MTTQTTQFAAGFICTLDELPEGQPRQCQTEAAEELLDLVVLRHGREVKAWHNVCPHQGRALNWAPDRFLRDERGHLVCAAHGAVFELEQGSCVSGPCRGAALTPLALRVEGSNVFVETRPPGTWSRPTSKAP